MKRSDQLAPLSRDHHQALFVAMQLKRGAAGAEGSFLDFLDGHGREHFRIEEEIVLPAWLAGDADADAALAARVSAEHAEILDAAQGLREGLSSADGLIELGELLERHVRFEERELFPLVESGLTRDQLTALGAEVAAAESA